MYNDKIYKYSIRDTTEPFGGGWEGSDDSINDDITTAQVTITAEDAMIIAPIVDEGSFIQDMPALTPGVILGQKIPETKTVTVALYKGACALVYRSLYASSEPFTIDFTVSGDASIQNFSGVEITYITGDCTISVLHHNNDDNNGGDVTEYN